jgi:uncharacterized membrane protein YfhO
MNIKKKDFSCLWLLTATNLIFVFLYRRFLFGDGVYLFTDIGSDSMSSSYPIIAMLGRLFRSGDFSSYNLTAGLGNDITGTFLQYLNPIKFLLLFFQPEKLPMGLMIMQFLTLNLTAIFARAYFKSILKNGWAALFPALAWTYSSYMVIWSQNLSFGICLLLFTATVFALENLLQKKTFPAFLVLTGILGLFLITNYYFTYITGTFLFFYLLIRSILVRSGFKAYGKDLTSLALSAFLSVFLAAAPLLAVIGTFLTSARTSSSSGSALRKALSADLGKTRLFTILARFFSSDVLGIGDSFSGFQNYYESVLIFTSILTVFAVIYLILEKSSRIHTILLLGLGVTALIIPFTGYITTFNWIAFRWSFMISFLECIAIGFFAKALLERPSILKLRISALVETALTAGLLLFIDLAASPHFYAVPYTRAIKLSLLFTVLYSLLFIIGPLLKERIIVLRNLPGVLLLLLCCELVLMNSDSLNLRAYVTKDRYHTSLYHNGVDKAAAKLKEADPSPYRISGDTSFNYANQGEVNQFRSLSAYSNTAPSSQAAYAKAMGPFQVSSNFFITDEWDYYMYTLLGGKYLIKDRNEEIQKHPEASLFQTRKDAENEKRLVFENQNALPFGYLYQTRFSSKDYEAQSAFDKMRALTQGFYLTDPKKDWTFSQGNMSIKDLLPHDAVQTPLENCDPRPAPPEECEACTVTTQKDAQNGEAMTTMSHGPGIPYVYYTFDTSKDTEETSRFLSFRLDDPGDSAVTISLYFLSEKHPEPGEDYHRIIFMNQDFPEVLLLLPEGTTGVRFDMPHERPSIRYSNLSIYTANNLSAEFDRLLSSSKTVRDIAFDERTDTYRAAVNAGEGSMLCVPIFYHPNWTAYVNGKKTAPLNINGGLIGIPLSKGTSSVRLVYRIPHLKTAVFLSGAAWLIYLAAWILAIRRSAGQKNHKKRRAAKVI